MFAKARSFGGRAFVAVVTASMFAVPALAQTGPPDMDAVEFPLEPSSIGTEIAVAAGVVLGIVFSIGLGFALVRKLFRRLKGAV